jgi:hypothetical protein
MQRSDIRAVGDLAGEASSVLTTLVRGMHAGAAGRVFDSIGPSAAPTRTIHDGLTGNLHRGRPWTAWRESRRRRGRAEIWGNEVDDALESRTDSVGRPSPR